MVSFISVIVSLTLITLIHELGHAFFASVFGGKVNKLIIGTGRTIFKFNKFYVKTAFFLGGEFSHTNPKINNKLSNALIHLGGTFFNLLSALILFVLTYSGLIPNVHFANILFEASMFFSIFNIIPLTMDGLDTDGKQLLQYFRNEKLQRLIKDEKNHPAIIERFDKEIARLKKLSASSRYEFVKSKYIKEIIKG
jgi:membrane-associated protease RseP (regulator of RpoE activity)